MKHLDTEEHESVKCYSHYHSPLRDTFLFYLATCDQGICVSLARLHTGELVRAQEWKSAVLKYALLQKAER